MTQRPPDRSPPHESASPRPPDRLAKILKWVTAGTAVLSLIFGVRTLTNILSERRAKEQQVVELLGTAQLQREGRDYASAWASLEQAAGIKGDDERVRRLQEDVAMNWLRDIRGDAGPSPFTRIVDQVTPVLNRGILAASGERIVCVGGPPLDDRPHLGYAIQWFGFALVAVVGAVVVAARSMQGRAGQGGYT